ncbi:V/A-type H+-transporting ATPase subunit D [Anaerosphaera aminiphila DSM 21120]|uniref:V-type ATP synthase subunit D n=1 Tax=Anaerosphaera aminiphila DSM 21120 TaxID=1120995 RepID=A0A1M5UBF5_9FIRM|nr:V-type ATP synthase subunit D [Anaerosphaera aminiphila]SHH60176.1 V/A-type H+-transporting ATPase subunit D [Anaerosphaera aminiphila DSM 21120]
MAKLNVSPTRMNLTTLKKRLETSTRGHKLLKDKQDELMRRFISIIKENKRLREEVEEELSGSFKDFLLASAFTSPEILEEAIMFPTQKINLEIKTKNVMSVEIPEMEFKVEKTSEEGSIYPYGYAQTTADVDDAIDKLNKIMQKLLELAQIEKSVQLMASEIESTRRRVNALEYKTIPDLQDTIRYIVSKLDENERANITRLMKVKDIITAKE